jgi:hypothetical protein
MEEESGLNAGMYFAISLYVFLAFIALCTCVLPAIASCFRPQTSTTVRLPNAPVTPVTTQTLDLIPVQKYEEAIVILIPPSPGHEMTVSEQDLCVICQQNYKEDDLIRQLPCHHYYHQACIDPWLTEFSPKCPLCKCDVKIEDENQGTSQTTNGTMRRWHRLLYCQ